MTARLIAIAALACAGCGAAAPRDAAATAAVVPGELVDRVLVGGALHPVSAVDLEAPSIDGATLTVRWVIESGTAVKAGDRVAAFDDAPFRSKLEDRRARLRELERKSRIARDTAVLGVEDKRLEVRRRRNDRDKARQKAELPSDLTTERAVKDNQLALLQGEVGLRKAEDALAAMIAKTALEQRAWEIDLERTRRAIEIAEHAITALVVVAPRDGAAIVATDPGDGHKLHAGDAMQDGAVIVSLPDLTRPMEVRAEISDVDDGRVRPGMAGTCTLDGYPADPLPCTVRALAPVARPRAPGSLRRSFGATLALGRGDPARLRPGMAVKVELVRRSPRALVVPRGAVLRDGAGGKLTRVRLGTGELRDVALAGCDAQRCAVASGLAEGDRVATDPGIDPGATGGRS